MRRWGRQGKVALGVASVTLLLAIVLYVVERAPGSAYLIPAFHQGWAPESGLLRRLIDTYPSFAHCFAFGVFTALLLPPRWAWTVGACTSWAAIDILIEFAQRPDVAVQVIHALPQWLSHVPVLDHLAPYLARGSFDMGDVAGSCLGAIAAVWMLRVDRVHM